MADKPVIELIALDLLETLCGVTVADGYSFDAIPERYKLHGNSPRDLLCVLSQGVPVEDPNTNANKTWIQPFSIDIYIAQGEDSKTDIDQLVNLRRADIEKAVTQDPYRSDLAFDTNVRAPELFEATNGSFAGVTVNIEVKYRTKETDPFTRA